MSGSNYRLLIGDVERNKLSFFRKNALLIYIAQLLVSIIELRIIGIGESKLKG